MTSSPTHSIYPTPPLFPELNKSLYTHDEQNDHFMYYFNKRQVELETRMNSHIKVAKAAYEKKKSKSIYNTNVNEGSETDNIRLDKDTDLVYGLGYDYLIKSQVRKSDTIANKDIDELVNKLGYLDLRDFLALNKYVLEAKDHDNLVNQTKAKFLQNAFARLGQIKKEEVRKQFKKIDELNTDTSTKDSAKIDYFLENVDGSKELFYKYYYKLKDLNEMKENSALNEFEKYEKMVNSINNSHPHESDAKTPLNSESFYDLNDYMERIIKKYRNERTKEIKGDSLSVLQKVKDLMNKNEKVTNSEMNNLIRISIYFSFLNKYKRIYTPTNIETEKLINSYLREKRIKEYTKDKMMKESDPYFSPLTDEDDFSNEKYMNIENEDEKQRAIEKHELKKKYFDAKYEYRLEKVKENVDKELADQLGIVLANNYNKKTPNLPVSLTEINNYSNVVEPGFIEELISNHYKSFKLDYMYNYLDFFSNKYQVRKKIAEEMQRKISISEINDILDKLAGGESLKDSESISKTKKLDLNKFVKAEYGSVKPTYFETLKEGLSESNPLENNRNKVIAKSAIRKSETETLELDENDKLEIEIYKGIKNDPYYRHYLKTNISYFAEKVNEVTGAFPHSFRGFV